MRTPSCSMRQLMEAGVHFGHVVWKWNPKMERYIYGKRNGIHILDLRQTLPLLRQALRAVREVARNGGRILFVGTKKQASKLIAQSAELCGQYYINHRWLGGTLTNWETISKSIQKLKDLEEQLKGETLGFTKREFLNLNRQHARLSRSLAGIKEMDGKPDLLFVIDSRREKISVQEAQRLQIPVIAILDSNSDPTDIRYPIPGNDDAERSIQLYCALMVAAVKDGAEASAVESGADPGEESRVDREAYADVRASEGAHVDESSKTESRADES